MPHLPISFAQVQLLIIHNHDQCISLYTANESLYELYIGPVGYMSSRSADCIHALL